MPRAKKSGKARAKAGAGEVVSHLYAGRSHNAWRRRFHQSNPAEKAQPRMRLRGGLMVDINQPWEKLHPAAQADNLAAARVAYDAVMKFPNDREAAADYIHKQWIARNKGDKSQPRDLFKPYAKLPEVEKDKDRAHVDQMKRAIAALAKPAKRVRKAAKRSARPARAPLAFTPAEWRRLEAANKSIAAALGREAPMSALIVASAEAIAALAAASTAKPKSRR